uniref:DNA polymerase delta subunit 2 n=1 Tax=Otus sunia TaxID=257818 RepID=A0A8C8B7W0_9STRI
MGTPTPRAQGQEHWLRAQAGGTILDLCTLPSQAELDLCPSGSSARCPGWWLEAAGPPDPSVTQPSPPQCRGNACRQQASQHSPPTSCWPRCSGPLRRSWPALSLASPFLSAGDGVVLRKLCELQAGEKCCVVGTLFKAMQLQPSILQEISEEVTTRTFPPGGPPRLLQTALGDVPTHIRTSPLPPRLGSRVVFASPRRCGEGLSETSPAGWRAAGEQHRELPGPPEGHLQSGSGGFGRAGGGGHAGGCCESQNLRIRVISVGKALEGAQGCSLTVSLLIQAKYLTKKTQAASVEAVKMLDEILLQLCTSVPVDVMPGEFDPTNYTLPQQPLHRCMLPLASTYSTLRLVTNPYQADVDGVRFLGTSGQNISDIFKYSSMDDYLEILEWTLLAGHISPTAPDTLGCYPFYKSDPFILTDCPHVYFCGNAPRFQSKLIQGEPPDGQRVLLVTVPAFSATQTACLVNLHNLSCQPISFSGFGAEDDDGDMEVGH